MRGERRVEEVGRGAHVEPRHAAHDWEATQQRAEARAREARPLDVHEEDGGLLWKHLDWRTGASTARRNRRLRIMFLATIANYTYGFSFTLSVDGSIHLEAQLTGILSMGALRPDELHAARRPPHSGGDGGGKAGEQRAGRRGYL